MSNRVEELESQVAELQAAVDGLTEELVETRERLRTLEEARDGSEDGRERKRVTPGGDGAEPAEGASAEAETGETGEAASGPEAEAESAEDDGAAAADADSDADSDSDDIIVA